MHACNTRVSFIQRKYTCRYVNLLWSLYQRQTRYITRKWNIIPRRKMEKKSFFGNISFLFSLEVSTLSCSCYVIILLDLCAQNFTLLHYIAPSPSPERQWETRFTLSQSEQTSNFTNRIFTNSEKGIYDVKEDVRVVHPTIRAVIRPRAYGGCHDAGSGAEQTRQGGIRIVIGKTITGICPSRHQNSIFRDIFRVSEAIATLLNFALRCSISRCYGS